MSDWTGRIGFDGLTGWWTVPPLEAVGESLHDCRIPDLFIAAGDEGLRLDLSGLTSEGRRFSLSFFTQGPLEVSRLEDPRPRPLRVAGQITGCRQRDDWYALDTIDLSVELRSSMQAFDWLV